MKNLPLSIRLPADMKAWIEARTILTEQSMNGVIVALLRDLMDNDPLTLLCIREHRGRYIVASAYTAETFGTFAMKDLAEHQARTALSTIGADPDNIVDEAVKGLRDG